MAISSRTTTSDNISTVTSGTFKDLVLNAKGEVVVEFMSYGCSHCHAIEPIVQQVARTMEATQKFYRVDVAVNADLEESYEIEGTPTFVMFLDGSEVGRTEGPIPTISSILAVVTEPYRA
jgi:thioredoxin 1